jgi:murein DD-endopeptidase MepM/ murein hydrolase activator NlpD
MTMRTLVFILVAGFLAACHTPQATKTIRIDRHAKAADTFSAPLEKARLISPFGPRSGSYHTGADLKAALNSPILASRDGRVVYSGWRSGYGHTVELRHADKFISRYAHLKTINVKHGQNVKKGEPLGIMGATGRASTPHLHFEILTPEYRFTDPCRFIVCRR